MKVIASIIENVKCPNCQLIALMDYYYKSDEVFIVCQRCGYNYSRYYKLEEKEDGKLFEEFIDEELEGHGVYVLGKKDGFTTTNLFNCHITDKHIEEFHELYLSEETDQEKSYLVRFERGEFKVISGMLPEDFFTTCENNVNPLILKPIWKKVDI
ncbi:hypothetical protein [Ureibacillus manganicus]|uniref:Uncharacterized protein n=1 Tax=Ureibacillus manganicus DSM 26584 TaxID=1384049 RepID=A0A0A3I7D7_9BACL|nr:hypothetical protein [Ureibacillus manganicus]KGR79425.1 hypothetical protein CD29_06965 [Ureibacillus manganicus DSM 26584]